MTTKTPKSKSKGHAGVNKNPVPKGKSVKKKLRADELPDTPARRSGHDMAHEFSTHRSNSNNTPREQENVNNTASEQEDENDSDEVEIQSNGSDDSDLEQLHINSSAELEDGNDSSVTEVATERGT